MSQRPYQAAQEEDSYTYVGMFSPAAGRNIKLPENISSELQDFLKWAINHPGKENQGELIEIRDQWKGGKAAISAKYFPKPKGADTVLWNQNKKLLMHVNLVGTAVRTWVNSVYADEAYRSAEGCDDAVSAWVESDEFASSMYAWAENKTAYGEAVAVPRWDEDNEELYTWLPDPVYTIVQYDPENKRRVLGIAEIKGNRLEFVSIWGEGLLREDQDPVITEFDQALEWLPAVVAGRGDNPKVRDALNATYSACNVLYNIRLLQKQQTRSILVRMEDFERLKAIGSGGIKKSGDTASIDLTTEGDAKFISPDPKIKESIETLRQVIIILATISGIPADVLDPTLTESASSAEGSRIRAIPFIQNSKPLMRAWRTDERSIVLAGEYLMGMVTGKRKAYKEVRKAVVVDIGLSTAAIPMTPNEETQDIIAKVSFGLMTPEDAVRKLNYTKSKTQIIKMANALKKKLEDDAQAAAQKALGGGRPPEDTGAGGSVNEPAAA